MFDEGNDHKNRNTLVWSDFITQMKTQNDL